MRRRPAHVSWAVAAAVSQRERPTHLEEHMHRVTFRLAAAGAAAALVTTACGGGGGAITPLATETGTPSAAPATTAEPAATTAEPAAADNAEEFDPTFGFSGEQGDAAAAYVEFLRVRDEVLADPEAFDRDDIAAVAQGAAADDIAATAASIASAGATYFGSVEPNVTDVEKVETAMVVTDCLKKESTSAVEEPDELPVRYEQVEARLTNEGGRWVVYRFDHGPGRPSCLPESAGDPIVADLEAWIDAYVQSLVDLTTKPLRDRVSADINERTGKTLDAILAVEGGHVKPVTVDKSVSVDDENSREGTVFAAVCWGPTDGDLAIYDGDGNVDTVLVEQGDSVAVRVRTVKTADDKHWKVYETAPLTGGEKDQACEGLNR